jgi:hypothetical protein
MIKVSVEAAVWKCRDLVLMGAQELCKTLAGSSWDGMLTKATFSRFMAVLRFDDR